MTAVSAYACGYARQHPCAQGLVGFLKGRFDAFFEDSYTELLQAHYATAAAASSVTWEQADAALRNSSQVTGGLSVLQRRQLFESHLERLRAEPEET